MHSPISSDFIFIGTSQFTLDLNTWENETGLSGKVLKRTHHTEANPELEVKYK